MTAKPASAAPSPSGSQSPTSEGLSSTEHDVSPPPGPSSARSRSDQGHTSPGPHRTDRRLSLELSRPSSAGKGGCWTCRLRRKKCDEQRANTPNDDSCLTCRRLQLECLGWGPKRPEWMRNKEEVQKYKADIKAHLLRLGLIRGQPRSTFLQSAPTTPPTSHAQFQYASNPPNSAAAGMHMFRQQLDPSAFSYRPDEGNLDLAFPSGIPSAAASAPPHVELINLPHSSSFPDIASLNPDLFSPDVYPISGPSSSPAAAQNILQFDAFGTGPDQPIEYDARALGVLSGADPNNAVRREHVVYYFTHARGLQYVFASRWALDAVHTTILQEPQGALTSAVCALSNLHYSSTQRGAEFDAAGYRQGDSVAQFFYEQACFQLESARRHAHYSEADAMTALHLISYALATSGGTIEGQTMRWAPMLEIACDWLTQTGVLVDENPRRTLVNMSAGGAFATKVTMYMDICMSVTLQQPPRLLALYRRLLGGGTSYWPGSGSHRGGVGSSAGVVDDLRLSEVTGCTDPVLLAFADISALAHWKARELANGTLSLRDLIARGTAIERALRERGEMITAEASRLLEYGRPAEDHSRRMIAAIFLESAVVYLNTVLSGCNPGVPEIIRSVNTIVQMLQYMPAGNHDRALLLPLCLTGSLVDSAQHRELIRSRLFRISSGNATVKQIIVVLNEIWQRRDVQGGIYDWRDVMREQGWTPLLV